MRRGNCYVASEALYHILGGPKGWWKPMVMKTKTDTHWFLKHKTLGIVLDPSRRQFKRRNFNYPNMDRWTPDYKLARGCGFLTKKPSKRAKALIKELTWQQT